MDSIISVVEKREFIRWFLNTYELKRRECAWLLHYLSSDDGLLENIHFVKKAECCPKAIIISTTDVDDVPFAFHKNQHVTTDAEKSFHDIRLNREERIYIQLNFSGAKSSRQFMSVLEENPYLPNRNERNHFNRLMAEMITDQALYDYQKERIMKRIDQALEMRDKLAFEKYTNELRQL